MAKITLIIRDLPTGGCQTELKGGGKPLSKDSPAVNLAAMVLAYMEEELGGRVKKCR